MKALEVRGKDAQDFLHKIFASHVKKLAVGEGNRGLLLNGQSKMIAQFDVLRREEKIFWLVSPEECFPELSAELERMHFSEELEIAELKQEFRVVKGESQGELEFSFKSAWPAVVPGFLVESGAGSLPADFHSARIGALVPWPKLDWDSSTNALEAGVLPWIDRYKGCYPGQEVVEKSLNLGHPARVLVAMEEVESNAKVSDADGMVTSRAENKILIRVPWKKKDLPVPGFRIIKTHF